MSIDSTREIIKKYLSAAHGDTSLLDDEVVFTLMSTEEETRGPEAVMGMFNYLYHVAFDATAKPLVKIYGEDHAAVEFEFSGKHIGEFAGVPATGKQVTVPMCVIYFIENYKIRHARIYFETPALMKQLGV